MSLQVGDESVTITGMGAEKARTIALLLLDGPEPEEAMAQAYAEAFSRKPAEMSIASAPVELPPGVREVDGRWVYRTKYDCMSCGNSGHRFIWSNSTYVKCHSCKEKMLVETAIVEADWENGEPMIDDAGYYFYADKAYEPDDLFQPVAE